MKISKIILIALAVAIPVLVNAQEKNISPAQENSKTTKWDRLTPLEKAREVSRIKGSRKIDVKPAKQTEGIKTGLVVAYGHVIPPPYKVEVVGERTFINGIQVVPSLLVERDVKPAQIPKDKGERYHKMHELEQGIKQKYYAGLLLKNKEKLQAEILELAKNNELIVSHNRTRYQAAAKAMVALLTVHRPLMSSSFAQ